MENQFTGSSRISIYATDTNNVLSRILQLFGKSRFEVSYIQVFKTTDENLKLIVVEASFPREMMTLILSRIEKIIEVHRAFPHRDDDLFVSKTVHTGFYNIFSPDVATFTT